MNHIFMTSQRFKILGVEFLPKTPPTETPGFLKFENGENMKHPNRHVQKQPYVLTRSTVLPILKLGKLNNEHHLITKVTEYN